MNDITRTAPPGGTRPDRRRVALVLGSGGARGYAHIGAIEALEQRGYEIVAIAGTSMGAVIGGIHAAGRLADYRSWVEGLDTIGVLRLLDPSFRLGAIQGDKVFNRIHDLIGDIAIEALPIEYTAVATDLRHQQEVWFRQGPLQLAMRASAAIPSLFTPVLHEGRTLVDGALLNPLPMTPVLSARSDLIVAVNLNGQDSARYRLPPERSPAMRERLGSFVAALESRLRFRRTSAVAGALPDIDVAAADPSAVGPPAGEGVDGNPLPSPQDQPSPAAGPAGSTPVASPDGDDATLVDDWAGPSSTLELINISLEVMQNALTQYKIAGTRPHVLVNVPKRTCGSFDFHRAPEIIALGRRIADDALDAWEAGRAC